MIEAFTEEDQILARYLLNQLGETETVKLEDEMLLNDELSERVQVVQMNLIDGYLRHELSDDEALLFEEEFLSLPENREEVRHAQMFHDGLRLLHEKEQVAPVAVVTHMPTWRQWIAGLYQRPLPALAFAAAAVLLIVALIAVFRSISSTKNGHPEVVNVNTSPTPPDTVNRSSSPAPERPVVITSVTPQQSPVVSSPNRKPHNPGIEIAENFPPRKDTKIAFLYRQEMNGVERGGGKVVQIDLKKNETNLRLIYELLSDAPKRESYGIIIKDDYERPIWPPNNGDKKDVKPFNQYEKGKLRKYIIVDVPASIFKDNIPYTFAFEVPGISSQKFAIKR